MDKTVVVSDPPSIEQLMEAYGTELFRLCCIYLKDIALAEDAVQDTFVKAYQNLERFTSRHAGSEKAWLMRIAINTCRDYYRSAWFRHNDRSIKVEEAAARTQEADPTALYIVEEVMALPIWLREAVLLHYYQGLSYEEVAKALCISRSSVQKRLSKARERLRKSLGGDING